MNQTFRSSLAAALQKAIDLKASKHANKTLMAHFLAMRLLFQIKFNKDMDR